MEKLFSDFKAATAEEWKNQIIKDLKGTDYEKLIWHRGDGINVQPFYTKQEQTHQPLFTHTGWDICEQITVNNETEANKRALEALKGGASGLSFYIHKKIDTKALVKDISLEHIYTQFFISHDALHIQNDLKDFYGKKNQYDSKIKCFINIDPVSLFEYYGEWHNNEEKDLQVIEQLNHLPVNASLYQEAGANAVTELALALAHTNEYFNYLAEKNLLKEKTLHFTFSIGNDFFTEIAKLRAFRKILALLQKQYQTNFAIHIHAQTSLLNKSHLDANTNMLRTTTEGMSAVIGGCDSLCVLPYNESFENTNSFSARISRNQQHLYKEESYLDKVSDMSAGSYYVEWLTEELAQKAWEEFKLIEADGGLLMGLKSGSIQQKIKEQAEQLIAQFKEEKFVLVGVNKFQNKSEVISQKPPIKNRVISSEVEKRSSIKVKSIKPLCLSDYLVKENA
jgi:methylmalonyl-CoA mutase